MLHVEFRKQMLVLDPVPSVTWVQSAARHLKGCGELRTTLGSGVWFLHVENQQPFSFLSFSSFPLLAPWAPLPCPPIPSSALLSSLHPMCCRGTLPNVHIKEAFRREERADRSNYISLIHWKIYFSLSLRPSLHPPQFTEKHLLNAWKAVACLVVALQRAWFHSKVLLVNINSHNELFS